MPHEVETMFYAGEAPWHRLGTRVDGLLTAQEAIVKAGLDWEVSMLPVYLDGNTPIENRKAVVRQSDRRVYTVVGTGYTPIQNRDAFGFFDQVVGSGQAVYETAGSLRFGSRVWILAKLRDSMGVAGEEVKKYVTLVNSHDGTMALQMFWTPVRVVCMNTLTMALSQASNRFYARHTEKIYSRVDAAKEVLGLANKFFDEWSEQASQLTTLQLPAAEMPKLLMAAFSQPDSVRMEDVYNPVKVQMEKVQELVEVGKGMDNSAIRGTRWAAYNAVAEFADYYKTVRKEDTDSGRRLESAWFGSGAQMKARAWNYLVTL